MRIRAVSLCVLPQPDNADRGEIPGFLCPGSGPHTHHASIANLANSQKLHNTRRYGLAIVDYTASSVHK
jgi:hypothetical protein